VTDLSATARLVYVALREADCALSTSELEAHTGASNHRVRMVLKQLATCDLVEPSAHPTDGRRKLWSAAGTGGKQ
jgi:DNA-binding MarR family transcriptional regulator